MKSVLLHINDDPGLETRMQAALDIVRASGGHLSCVHATSPYAYVAFDGFGGVFVMQDVMNAITEQEAKMRTQTEARLCKENVSWDYQQMSAEVGGALTAQSFLNDLIVMGLPTDPKKRALAISQIGDVLMHTRVPLLLIPDKLGTFKLNGAAMVAWNGSREAAQALRQAVPLLAYASAVHLVTVENEKEASFPSIGASEYLSRHGIKSELHDRKADKFFVEYELESYAKTLNADYLVMGAYSRNRASEYLFGGVTRYMLKETKMPILLAH